MQAIDWSRAPKFKPPTKFEKVLDDFYRDMEDNHSQAIGCKDVGDVYVVTVELGYMAHWFDVLQKAYDEERREQ